jgi:hypothetical protein
MLLQGYLNVTATVRRANINPSIVPKKIFSDLYFITRNPQSNPQHLAGYPHTWFTYPQFTKVCHPFPKEIHTVCAKEKWPRNLVRTFDNQDVAGLCFSSFPATKKPDAVRVCGLLQC